MIKVYTLGGYNEVGRNMTAIEYNDTIVILDMGICMEHWLTIPPEDRFKLSEEELIAKGVLPNDISLRLRSEKVKAIVLSHAHMDHYYGVYWLAKYYNAPIICTPYTAEILESEENLSVQNKIVRLNLGSRYRVSKDIEIEFIYSTHSTPQSAIVAIHTPDGVVVYANDWKFDNAPIIGRRPNKRRLKELGEENVILLITDCLRASEEKKTFSEKVVRDMLEDIMISIADEPQAIFGTTFSSHVARVITMSRVAQEYGREVVILGRSMYKHLKAAENIGLISWEEENIRVAKFGKEISKVLKEVEKEGRDKYFIILTGGQGEPDAVLMKILEGKIQFDIRPGDIVIFSNRVIPSAINKAQRAILEHMLKEKGVRMFKDVHVSGHASKEDIREMIRLLKPANVLPAHGPITMQSYVVELCMEEGYEYGKNVFMAKNGMVFEFGE